MKFYSYSSSSNHVSMLSTLPILPPPHTHTHSHTFIHCVQSCPCSLGTFGDLRVNFTVQSADAASLATADGTPPLDYFSSPTSNMALNESVLLVEVEIATSGDRLEVCTTACLSDQACRSFASDGVAFCQLYLSTQTADTVVMRGGVSFYEKNENMVMQ